MKIISILGSPHGLKGNTAGLLRHVLAGAESEGAQTEVIILKGDAVMPAIRKAVACRRTTSSR